MNKSALLNNSLSTRHKSGQNMGDYVSVLESKFTGLPFTDTEFDDWTRSVITISTL